MKHYVSQKRQPLRRTLVYSFMTAIVVMIVTIMVLLVQGYTFNEEDGMIEQGGLLQFASVPTGATVTLNDEVLGSKTNTKATVTASDHTVKFELAKYHPWTKDITLDPGQVGWVNYARLIPVKLPVETRRVFPMVADSLTSPKRNYMFVQEQLNQPDFQLLDIRSNEVRATSIQLPVESYTQAPGQTSQFSIEGWSANEDALLIKHTYANSVEWIVLDRSNPEESVNINQEFAIKPKKVLFAGESDRLFFVQIDDLVRRVSISDSKSSRQLATGVDTFSSVNDGTIVYTTVPNELGTRVVGYASVEFIDQQIVRAYPNATERPLAAMGTYFGKKHIAVIYDDKLIVDTGRLSTPSLFAEMRRLAQRDIPTGATKLSISNNGRFVVIEYSDKYAVYDIELDKFDITKWAAPSKSQSQLSWFDDYIVWSDNGGLLRIYDFDGDNQQNLMKVTEGLGVALTNDGKYVYGMLKTANGVELRRVQLIL